MAKIKMKMKNFKGKQIIGDVEFAVGRGLYQAASHIRNESNNIAPLDEGTLTQTSGVDVDTANRQASIYYTQPYARRLHESQSMNIRRGRQNKYLEKPMIEQADTVQKIIAKELKNVFKG